MTRLDWDAARQREAARPELDKPGLAATSRQKQPPTGKQLAYLRALADELGRDCPTVTTRRQAAQHITQYRNMLAVRREPRV